ncbi:MAG: hypothetical protein JO041_03805, partial [Acidobacteria bacterium]|nr:hypothetical protein [Acidobacteriota bacterium]
RREHELEIRGLYRQRRASIVLSHHDNAPALTISLEARATFALVLLSNVLKGRNDLLPRTVAATVAGFANTHTAQTDNPGKAVEFFSDPGCSAALKELVTRSPQCFSINEHGLQFSEAVLPDGLERGAAFALEQLWLVAIAAGRHKLLKRADYLVGGLGVFVKRRTILAWSPAALALVASAVIATLPSQAHAPDAAKPDPIAAVPMNRGWRLASAQDFDTPFRALAGDNLPSEGTVELDPGEGGKPDETAYLLVGNDGSRRLVIMARHGVCYDNRYVQLSGILRIPKEKLPLLAWPATDLPPAGTLRDGLMVVIDPQGSENPVFITQNCKVYAARLAE